MELKERFDTLKTQWKQETILLSNMTKIVEHPAYREIINMGPDVLPYILEDLRTVPDYWFEALRQITGENPVPEMAEGALWAMTKAWLKWADKKGF